MTYARTAARWLRYEVTNFARWLPAMVLALLMVFGGATAAAAATPAFPNPFCGGKDSPAPARPDTGAVAWFTHKPNPLPPQGDPFAAQPTTTIYEQYGVAGMTFHTYDLGCGGSISNAPSEASNAVANWVFAGPKIVFALTAAIANATLKPTWLAAFDDPLTKVTRILHDAVFSPLGPFLLILAAATIIWGAMRMRIGTAITMLLMTLVAITLVALATNYPVRMGHVADQTVVGVITAVNGQISGVDPTSNPATDPAARNMSALYTTILYEQWLAGELGSSDSATARKYGPDLLKASALTWSEAETMDRDEAAGKRIVKSKEDLWESTASAIKDSDPDAYEYLRGTRDQGVDRVVAAGLAGMTSLLLLPFLLFSFLMMLASFIVIRLLVMLLPLICTIALLPQMHGVLRTVGEIGVASIFNTIAFSCGTAVTIVAAGGILSSGSIPPWLGVVLVSILCFAMWVILRPVRQLTRLATGHDPLRQMADSGPNATSRVKQMLGLAAASFAGNAAADIIEERREDRRARPETFSRPEPEMEPVAPPVPVGPAITAGYSYPMPGSTGPAAASAGAAGAGASAADPVILTVVPLPSSSTLYAPRVHEDGALSAGDPAMSGVGAHRAITAEPEPAPAAIEQAPAYTPQVEASRRVPDPVIVDDGTTLPAPVAKQDIDENGQPVWIVYSPGEGFTRAGGTEQDEADA